MTTFKNIRIKKPGGGTRLQRVKVLASGKYRFVKNIRARARKKKASNPKKKTRRSVRKTAKKKRRSRRKFTIPLAPIAGVVAGMAEPVKHLMNGQYEEALYAVSRNYTGYRPQAQKWEPQLLMRGLVPLIVGGLVHKFVGGSLGINRMLAQAGVPIIRI